MRGKKPIVAFVQVSGPNELASLVKAVIKKLFTPLKRSKSTQLPMAGIKTRINDTACPYCDNVNPSGSEFCHKCGFAF